MRVWDVIKKKGSFTELAGISKPFVYIMAIINYGTNSLYPIVIAFLFHVASLLTSVKS